MAELIDLRSDTVTRPTAAMRAAMAAAEVGDDVFADDPTVNRLQEVVAARLGKEAALLVPSGTQANQIALLVHCRPGDDVILGDGAHQMFYESGAGAALAGVQFTVAGTGGLFDGAAVTAALHPDNVHHSPSRLVSVENTHNRGGGRIWPREQLAGVVAAARGAGLALHLDGARLWNAEVASGVPAAEWAAPFDTVSVCLSKGLGAPVGSLLAGRRELIRRAHRFRKMLGGGMRQAGILAAAGLFALDHHVARLADDHAHAQLLAARLGGLRRGRLRPVETNIVLLELAAGGPTAETIVLRARERGLLLVAMGARLLRAVTHLDVDGEGCARAAAVIAELVDGGDDAG